MRPTVSKFWMPFTCMAALVAMCRGLAIGSASIASPPDQELLFQHVNDAFLMPVKNCRNFDSELWKRDESSRAAMLFDLGHKQFQGMTVQEAYAVLGQPVGSEVGNENSHLDFYRVGKTNGVRSYLVLDCKGQSVNGMSLERRSRNGSRLSYEPVPWELKNLTWPGFADDYNHQYFLVGTPVKLIRTLTCCAPTKSSSYKDSFEKVKGTKTAPNVHCFCYFEIEYTCDQQKVKRFRVGYTAEPGVQRYTGWQDQDLRTDPRCGVTESTCSMLKDRRDHYFDLFEPPFSSKGWMEQISGGTGARCHMLTSLARSYPLIGMSRTEIDQLLGPGTGDQVRHTPEEIKSDPLCADVRDYLIVWGRCGMAPRSYFELAFKQDHVVGYHVIWRPGSGRELMDNGPGFDPGDW